MRLGRLCSDVEGELNRGKSETPIETGLRAQLLLVAYWNSKRGLGSQLLM